MAGTGSRILALLALLESRRYWPGTELADRLGVSPRTLRRDVERLRELGYPVEAARGIGGGYQLGAGTALPPLVLDDEEAVALVVGLHTAADSPVAGVAESSVRALAKTLSLMPPPPPPPRRRAPGRDRARHRGGGSSDTVAPEILDVVARRVSRRGPHRLLVHGARRGRVRALRRAVPARGARAPLVPARVRRRPRRLAHFRVDRMGETRATVGRFDPRPLPDDPAAFVRDSIESDAGPARGGDRRAGAGEAGRRADRTLVRDLADRRGGCRVRMTADELEWPVLALAQLDADFTVVEPPELVEKVAAIARPVRPRGRRLSRRARLCTDIGPQEVVHRYEVGSADGVRPRRGRGGGAGSRARCARGPGRPARSPSPPPIVAGNTRSSVQQNSVRPAPAGAA